MQITFIVQMHTHTLSVFLVHGLDVDYSHERS